MAYQALYRKYRPKTFDEVVGQNHITNALKNQVKNGTISHAYLFAGTRGTGKTTCAKIFARAINCENNKNGSPCFECTSCKALDGDTNMDILEMDAASNNKVDDIREVREKVTYPPMSGKYKVYIIDEVHMLTDSAFNALLKTLEEPPKHAVFILATTEIHKIPQTILSRCMRFDFRLVSTETLVNHLKGIMQKEGIRATDEALKAIAVAGQGSVRDTLSMADCVLAFKPNDITLKDVLDVVGANDHKTLLSLADAVMSKDVGRAFEVVSECYERGKNFYAFARDMADCFRNLLICKTCKKPNDILNFTEENLNSYVELAQKSEQDDLLWSMRVFCFALSEIKLALSPRVLLENAIITAMDSSDSKKN